MTKKITIAIDAMGGENAPKKNIEGLNIFLNKNKSNNDFIIHLYGNKKILDEVERWSKIVRDAGKSVGCLFHSKEELNFFKSIGINLLVYSVDSSILYNEFSQIKNWR